jgi:hypothetical protein
MFEKDTLESRSASFGKDDKKTYVTMTEWASGEGYDITIEGPVGIKIFQLHLEELYTIMAIHHGWYLEGAN